MLYLEPPFHIIDGVSVFRDHEDVMQYYFMPLYPHLTTVKDTVSGVEIPQIQLIKYRGEAGSGGFLNFDVNLGIPEDQLEDLRSSIQSLEGLRDTPRLAPVPLLDGSVKLMMLGKQTVDSSANPDDTTPPIGPPATGPQFVIKMVHYAKPALYGSNQAAFSVQLDEAGVAVVEQSMQGEMAPIGVVYALDYMCLRNGYKIKVTADWERVQKHLEKSFSVNTPIFSSSVDTLVDELIEERAIDMQIDKLFVTDESTSAMEARMDQAINQVKDMVLDNFFEPSLEPIEKMGSDTIADVGRVARMVASGGASEIKLFSYKEVDITRIDKKKLNVNLSERSAAIRSIYPQGHLQGLFSTLRQPGVDLSRFVIPVELDHPWFAKRNVKVIARTDFTSDNIESLNVTLTYGASSKNVVLDKANPTQSVHWLSNIVDGTMEQEVKARFVVHFKDVDSMERPSSIASAEEKISVENYEVRPRDLYGSTPVMILALDFPWEIYSHVEVAVRYVDAKNDINIDENFLLDKEHTEIPWNLFTLDRDKKIFSYGLRYRSIDHRDLIKPWQDSEEENIIIRDPFPDKRVINFVPAVNWAEVKNIFVDVVYSDEKNAVREQHSTSFSESDNNPKEIAIQHFKNPEVRIVQYKITLIFADGRVQEIPTCQTIADRVFITPQMRGHKIVAIDPSSIPFADKKIKEARLNLSFTEPDAGLAFTDHYIFNSSKERPRYFEYDFTNAENSAFTYQLDLFFENGMKKTGVSMKSNDDVIKLAAI